MDNDDEGFNTDDLDAYLEDAAITEMVKPIAALFKSFQAQGLSVNEAAILATTFLIEMGKHSGGE